MKFIINREELLIPLQQIVNVIEKRQTMPVLANILLKLSADSLILTGTDLEIQVMVQMEIKSADTGEITVPARKFLDICRLLPSGAEINFAYQNGKVTIQSGSSRFTLSTLAADSYPDFPENEPEYEFTIQAEKLKKALDRTIFCMANQDFRYYLNGLMMHISNSTLKLVTSDGHRLAIYEQDINQATGIDSRIIIPRKAVQELSRILDTHDEDATLQISKNNFKVLVGNLVFLSKLIDAKYPDFSKIYQQDYLPPIQINKQALKETLTRVAILANEQTKGIILEINSDHIFINSYNPEHEEAEEKIAIEFTGTPSSITFNVQYLLEALANLDSELAILSIASNLSSCFIEEPHEVPYKFIVMPMTL